MPKAWRFESSPGHQESARFAFGSVERASFVETSRSVQRFLRNKEAEQSEATYFAKNRANPS